MKKQTTRRDMVRGSAKLAGSAFLAQLFPASLLRAAVPDLAPQTPADLTSARDMLVTAVDRVEKLKAQGETYQEASAAKPLADLDATWAKGMLGSDLFIQVIYLTL